MILVAAGAALLPRTASADMLVLNTGGGGTRASGDAVVWRFDAATGATLGRFGHDTEGYTAMTLASADEVCVTSNILGGYEIYRFNGAGQFIDKVGFGRQSGFGSMFRGPDGALYSTMTDASTGTGSIVRHGANGPTTFVPAGAGGMTHPEAVVPGPDGRLYVADRELGVLRFDANTGAFIDVMVPAGRGGLIGAGRMAFGADGRLYVTSTRTQDVKRFDGATGAFVDTFVTAGRGGLDVPGGLAFGPDGDLYVVSRVSARVLRFSGVTGAFLNVAAADTELRRPLDIVFTPTPEA